MECRNRYSMEPYKKINAKDIYYNRRPVKGKIVAILDLYLKGRDLSLIIPQSRTLKRGEIHEIIFTHEHKYPGDKVDTVYYVGFFEIEEGGVVITGDILSIGGIKRAELIGFNETHMPNHQNIIFYTETPMTGKMLGIGVGDSVEFIL